MFPVTSGVKQGDTLSPTLFCIYINDLAITLKVKGIGINVNGQYICLLLYADDLVLLAENEKDLQMLLDITQQWCHKWKLNINREKSKIVHFRNARKKQSEFKFSYGSLPLPYTNTYKYLGLLLDQHLNYNDCIRTLADSESRALGSVISKLKSLKDVRYKTYSTLYNTQILPILNYCSSVWAHKKANECDVVQKKSSLVFYGCT